MAAILFWRKILVSVETVILMDTEAFLKTSAQVFLSLFFLGGAFWKGAQEIVVRRKRNRTRMRLQEWSRTNASWNEEELVAKARNLCSEFWEGLNLQSTERLKNITHPECWEAVQKELSAMQSDVKKKPVFHFAIQSLTLVDASNSLPNQEEMFSVKLDFSGKSEVWTRNGPGRSRFVKGTEIWVFRSYLGEWKIADRYDSWPLFRS